MQWKEGMGKMLGVNAMERRYGEDVRGKMLEGRWDFLLDLSFLHIKMTITNICTFIDEDLYNFNKSTYQLSPAVVCKNMLIFWSRGVDHTSGQMGSCASEPYMIPYERMVSASEPYLNPTSAWLVLVNPAWTLRAHG